MRVSIVIENWCDLWFETQDFAQDAEKTLGSNLERTEIRRISTSQATHFLTVQSSPHHHYLENCFQVYDSLKSSRNYQSLGPNDTPSHS